MTEPEYYITLEKDGKIWWIEHDPPKLRARPSALYATAFTFDEAFRLTPNCAAHWRCEAVALKADSRSLIPDNMLRHLGTV